MSLESLIQTYGYAALFLGTFLEGETVLVIAGFMARRGYLELPWVVLVAFAGSFVGDQLFFFLGRWNGCGFLSRRPRWQERANKVHDYLHRYQVAVVLGFRFLYGLRNVTPLVIGASGFRPARFVILNMLGALLWAFVIGSAGYLLGNAVEIILDDVKKYERWLLLILVVGGAAAWCFHVFIRTGRSGNEQA